MTILAIVNAEKEGQIESKMIKARQMEAIREAKRKEAEARAEIKKSKLVRYLTTFFCLLQWVKLLIFVLGERQRRTTQQEEEKIKRWSYYGR